MDAIIELVLELFFEFMAEFGFVLIGKVFNKVETNKKSLKAIKITIYSILAILLIALLVTSLIYKKGIIVVFVLSYFGLLLVAYYLIFLFNEVMVRPIGAKIVRWIVRIIRYPFAISLIILASLYLKDDLAKALMITGSIIGIIIFIFIDSFRIHRYNSKIKIKEDIKE